MAGRLRRVAGVAVVAADVPRSDHHEHHRRDLLLVDEILDHGHDSRTLTTLDEAMAVLPDHDRRGLIRVNSRRRIDPIGNLPPAVRRALVDELLGQFALRYAVTRVGIGAVSARVKALAA